MRREDTRGAVPTRRRWLRAGSAAFVLLSSCFSLSDLGPFPCAKDQTCPTKYSCMRGTCVADPDASASPSSPAKDRQDAATTGRAATPGCGVTCTDSKPCGPGLACLPSSQGGKVCKPDTCPACSAGKFCSYDTETCEPSGCSSATCGFNTVGACDDCVHASCCSQGTACASDPGCHAIVACVGACGANSNCKQSCVDQGKPASRDLFGAMINCWYDKCQSQCY
jgi:hypothetical protein